MLERIEKREGKEPGELMRLTEARIRSGANFGVDYFIPEKPKLTVPYNNFLKHRKVQGKRTIEHVIADVIAAVEAAGVDPAEVIAYERENDNNQTLIAALEALTAPEPVEEPVVAA